MGSRYRYPSKILDDTSRYYARSDPDSHAGSYTNANSDASPQPDPEQRRQRQQWPFTNTIQLRLQRQFPRQHQLPPQHPPHANAHADELWRLCRLFDASLLLKP